MNQRDLDDFHLCIWDLIRRMLTFSSGIEIGTPGSHFNKKTNILGI